MTAQSVSPQAQKLINALQAHGVSKGERVRLLNLIENFYPYKRKPYLPGDLVIYEAFGLKEVFEILNEPDALAIKGALDRCPIVSRREVPLDKVYADDWMPSQKIVVIPKPSNLPSLTPQNVADFKAITPTDRVALFDAVFALSAHVEQDTDYSYSAEIKDNMQGIQSWLQAMSIQENEGPVLSPLEEESRAFFNELRLALMTILARCALEINTPTTPPQIGTAAAAA